MALAHAILASLVESSCSGYDLAKKFDGSVGFFWAASHQQIYRELSKLENQGWITPETILLPGRPDKKLYSVTELGRKHLKSWIAEPSEPTAIKDDILVKIFAGYIASPSTILEEIKRHSEAHQKRLVTYQKIQQQYFQNPQQLSEQAKFQHLTLLNGIGYETYWLAWCDEAIKLLG
ncbi:MAG: PadR family transcriptional regulator [Cyanomargarita calcarea GSE-NOS-MK-12-04C]|jgi:DNA-binding PadR family transcriptional regulator|uniref:PadR family transcriptional regulator n=1 Tax=Cyanomargarita calcarea GSE-NOS-MK-12-04C TaxID=2839659 RepID=A0A951QTJ7_9CYAN|nr:PadR family transcriptional regulator [Cyanomargarita calcarea GSE-NOS-MK-12-04C]